MDAVAQLIARNQIRELALRYSLGRRQGPRRARPLFVEDVDNGRYGPGREGVKAFYDQSLRNFHCSMHLVADQ